MAFAKGCFGARPVFLRLPTPTERGISAAELRVELQGSAGSLLGEQAMLVEVCGVDELSGGIAEVRVEHPRLYELGVECERLLDLGDGASGTSRDESGSRALSQQVQVTGSRIDGRHALDPLALGGRKLDAQRPRHLEGDLALDREDVAELAFVRLRPQRLAGRGVGEMRASLARAPPSSTRCR